MAFTYDIEEFFEAARPFIPRELLGGAGWSRLVDRVRDLPGWATMSNLAAFEFRLGDSEPAADFGTQLFRGCPLLDHYIQQGRDAPADSRAAAMGRFFARMGQSAHHWPQGAMLEYDLWGLPEGERPDPGLFVNIAPLEQAADIPSTGDALYVLSDALCLDRDEHERRAVENVCAALPEAAYVNSIGAMPDRALRSVRLPVDGIAAHDVAGFLNRIAWTGPIEHVQEIIDDMVDVAPRFRLAVDVSAAGPMPRIGLEMHPQVPQRGFGAWLRSQRGDWQPIIERCMARQWCLPDKGGALLDYTGLDYFFDPDGVLGLYRGIAVVKITVSERDVQAKAYAAMVFFSSEG